MIQAVIFDMDGTITRPWLDFAKIRAEIGVGEPILERMLEMPEGPDRRRAFDILARYEAEAVEASELNVGAHEVLRFLAERGIRTGLVTRNSRLSVRGIMDRHGISFDVVVTREDAPIKPSPEPLLLICRRLDVGPERAMMVGDFKFDVMAGQAAGMRTCLLTNGGPPKFSIRSDHVIDRLTELIGILA